MKKISVQIDIGVIEALTVEGRSIEATLKCEADNYLISILVHGLSIVLGKDEDASGCRGFHPGRKWVVKRQKMST